MPTLLARPSPFALPFVDGSVAAVYAVAVGLSAGAVFFNPAAQSVIPVIVRERELVAANSGLWTAAVLSQIVLAPVAGLVVASFGYRWAFWINAASYLVSAVVLRQPRVPTTVARPSGRTSWLADVRNGLTVLVGHRLLRSLAAGQFLAALSVGALLVVLAREHLGLDARDYGLLLGAIGIGAAAGPLLLARLTDNPRRPGYVFGPFVLRAAVDAVLATATGLVPALAALAAYGIGTSTGAVTFNSLLQAATPEQLRGGRPAACCLCCSVGCSPIPSASGPSTRGVGKEPVRNRHIRRGRPGVIADLRSREYADRGSVDRA